MSKEKIPDLLSVADSAALRRMSCQDKMTQLASEIADLQQQIDTRSSESQRYETEMRRQDEIYTNALDHLAALGMERSDAEKLVTTRVRFLPKIEIELPSPESKASTPRGKRQKTPTPGKPKEPDAAPETMLTNEAATVMENPRESEYRYVSVSASNELDVPAEIVSESVVHE